MPMVGIPVAGRDFSVYRIALLAALGYFGLMTLKNDRIKCGKQLSKLILWLALAALACLIGALFLRGQVVEWGAAAKSNLPKVLILLVFALLWGSSGEARRSAPSAAAGFLLGCTLNCLWAAIDAGCYYLLGFSLHNRVFAGYIARNGLRYGMASLILRGMIRAGGFNYDPAHLGFLAPVLTGYAIKKKKYWLLLIAVAGIAASASTTGLICSLLCALMMGEGRRSIRIKTSASGTKLFAALLLVPLVLGALVAVRGRAIPMIQSVFSSFFERINTFYVDSDRDNVRFQYVLYSFPAMLAALPFLLLGTGIGTASYGYAMSPLVVQAMGDRVCSAYDMENTYLAYLFDTGLLGVAVYLVMLWTLFRAYRRRCRERNTAFDAAVYATVCAAGFTMLFYHYILYAPQLLMFTAGLSWLDEEA